MMKPIRIFSAMTLLLILTNAGATEITTCVIDSSIKTNPRVYFFPISSSQLRCDHIIDNTPVTLSELYEQNWRLLQVVNPVEFKQKDNVAGFTPVLLYLERTKRPPATQKQTDVSTTSSYSSDDTNADSSSEETSSENSGGIFGNWFKGEKPEETESE